VLFRSHHSLLLKHHDGMTFKTHRSKQSF